MDEVRKERQGWRYLCHRWPCTYVSKPDTLRAARLVEGVHRHRHVMGLNGVYHRGRD